MTYGNENQTPGTRFRMADVADKAITRRQALAGGRILVGRAAFELLEQRQLPKGDALLLAEVAGIQAAKLTPQLLPLCHPLALNRVQVHSRLDAKQLAVEVYALADIAARTGVEMEALTAVSVALLTIWDLVKPVEPALRITDIRLLHKSGGKHGDWQHPDGLPEDLVPLLGSAVYGN